MLQQQLACPVRSSNGLCPQEGGREGTEGHKALVRSTGLHASTARCIPTFMLPAGRHYYQQGVATTSSPGYAVRCTRIVTPALVTLPQRALHHHPRPAAPRPQRRRGPPTAASW